METPYAEAFVIWEFWGLGGLTHPEKEAQPEPEPTLP